jgi:PadR family transcriptional regulator AphA
MYRVDTSTDLTPTAKVVLGMLALGARTGYDIKRAIDLSTRFFWNASYGQIYPELHRLAERGLVSATPDPPGGRRRTSYALTASGRAVLGEWLRDDTSMTFEARDESVLRLFFGDLLGSEDVIANLRAKQHFCEQALALFREIEPQARTGFMADDQLYPYVSLLYGIELLEWMYGWCDRTATAIEAGELPPKPLPSD